MLYEYVILTHHFSLSKWQGLTFPVAEVFLEDVLEETRYNIKSEFDNIEGSSRRKRRQQDPKKDPLTELFEVWFHSLPLQFSFCLFKFTIVFANELWLIWHHLHV